jgi:hypothetical protein
VWLKCSNFLFFCSYGVHLIPVCGNFLWCLFPYPSSSTFSLRHILAASHSRCVTFSVRPILGASHSRCVPFSLCHIFAASHSHCVPFCCILAASPALYVTRPILLIVHKYLRLQYCRSHGCWITRITGMTFWQALSLASFLLLQLIECNIVQYPCPPHSLLLFTLLHFDVLYIFDPENNDKLLPRKPKLTLSFSPTSYREALTRGQGEALA